MNKIASFFKEEWNRTAFEKQNLVNRIQILDKELSELEKCEHSIESHKDDSDYVFQADCFEKSMDERTLDSIEERRREIQIEKQGIEAEISEKDSIIEKFRTLYDGASDLGRHHMKKDLHDRLEFVLRLMDSDIQRAKLELASILKEEGTDAN